MNASPHSIAITLDRVDAVWSARFRALGGPCEVLVDGGPEGSALAAATRIADEAWRIEQKFSRYRADSVIGTINQSAGTPVVVDTETANLLDFAALVHSLSDGMFDVTSGVLRRAWVFDGRARVPSDADIAALLPLIGWNRVTWQRPHLLLQPGMQLDFGGLGKEYAVDQALRTCVAGCELPALVNFAGDLAATAPRLDGAPWRVGIESTHASQPQTAASCVDLYQGAIATSGDTYRFVEANGVRLPHILNPRTGRPIEGAPRSVTAAAATCTQAGMLTTLAMLRGPGAEEFLRAENVRCWIQRS